MKHLRDDVAAGRRRLYIRAICPSLREAPLLYSYPYNGVLASQTRHDYCEPPRESWRLNSLRKR